MKPGPSLVTLAAGWMLLALAVILAIRIDSLPVGQSAIPIHETEVTQWKSSHHELTAKRKVHREQDFQGDLGNPQLPYEWTGEIREDVLPAAIR